MKKLNFVIILMCAALILSTSCATIVSGRKQIVAFNSDPQGAKVLVDNIEMGTTPTTLSLSRKTKLITVRKEGYNEGKIQFLLKTNGWYWGNWGLFLCFMIPGVIGMWIDIGTGAAFKFDNESYSIKLEKAK
ncbi:MAG: PEGA domain-containing protein [Bacteroidia bacterium]|nr:PEGA domain-containing protein [Bacteroidia bacterium]